jgi:gliding motility-associated-like protein
MDCRLKIKLLQRHSQVGLVFVLFLSLFFSNKVFSQYNLIVNDSWVVVDNSAQVFVGGDLINEQGNGSIKLDGCLRVRGDIQNNSSNNMFLLQQSIPTGRLIACSNTHEQYISGIGSPIHFPNLIIEGKPKKLIMNNCQVNNCFTVNAELNLNSKNFIINNKNPEAINYISGFIRSESLPPFYGTIQWNTQNNTGAFTVPFGSGLGNTNDLDLTLNVQTPGSIEGHYRFATYPTNDFTNTPFPTSVISLMPFQDVAMVDRFWFIEPDYISRPNVSIDFSYSMIDIDSPNKIKQSTLQAIRHNDYNFKWDDWVPGSTSDVNTKIVSTNTIPKQHQYSHWTLVSEDMGGDLWIPNAFTPDRDEYYTNEYFGPVITFPYAKYEFYVFDRWGKLIFESDNIDNKWDGTHGSEVVCQGTYVWLIIITKHSTKKYKYNGIVNVIL